MSALVVMIRPVEDDPLAQFAREMDTMNTGTGYSVRGSAAGSDYGTDEESGDSDETESDTDEDDYGVGEGEFFRLRGGSLRHYDKHNIAEDADPDYIVPAGIERPDGSHRTRVMLHLQLHETCWYDVEISSKTAFKFQTEKGEPPHALTEPITRPQVLSCVDLKVETRPFEVLPDRSYSNVGFIVHRARSIAGREYLPAVLNSPHQ
ncbi:hypothetical protein C8R44DRAFT_755610 [Mycena epipterygia]|nr:hypothetical protein C8R44DRAFT_755610 [Mycena epipterygia]